MFKRILISFLLLLFAVPSCKYAQETISTCEPLREIFNTEIEEQNGVCKLEIIRENLDVTHMGKKLHPETMELVFHMGFEKIDSETAVMGEMALLEEEVNPVIDELRKGKIEVSAIHNHMIHEQPKVMYLHFQAIGDMNQLATTIKNAISITNH